MNENQDDILTERKEDYKGYKIIYINPNIDKNINIGYLLCVPDNMENGAKLAIQTNTNTFKKDDVEYVDSAVIQTEEMIDEFEGTNAPILMPIMPCEEYFRCLGPECFDGNVEEQYKRIDIQVSKCVADAKDKIKEITGKETDEKIMLTGKEDAALFAQRYALLHPEEIESVCVKEPIENITLPLAEHKGENLNYPLGISNYKEVTDEEFDLQSYKKVKFLYLGTKSNEDINKKRKTAKKCMNVDFKEFEGLEVLDVRNFYADCEFYKEESKILKFANQIRGMLDKITKKEQEILLLTSGNETVNIKNIEIPGTLTQEQQLEYKRKEQEIYQTRQTADIAKQRLKRATKGDASIEL